MFRHPISLFYYAPALVCKAALKWKFRNSWGQIPDGSEYLFIHIPKTGGSSLGRRLYGNYINHVSAKIHFLSDYKYFAQLYSFAVVRHPAERFISAVNHCIGNSKRGNEEDLSFGKRLLSKGDNVLSIAEALTISPGYLTRVCGGSLVFIPQIHWICNRNEVMVDRLFALREGRRHLNRTIANSVIENQSQDESKWGILSQRALDVIRDVYEEDWCLYDRTLETSPITDVHETLSLLSSSSKRGAASAKKGVVSPLG